MATILTIALELTLPALLLLLWRSAELADQVARIVRSIRALELKKAPSVSETLDWARTLVLLGVETIDAELARNTLNVLLKYKTDLDRVAKELDLDAVTGAAS